MRTSPGIVSAVAVVLSMAAPLAGQTSYSTLVYGQSNLFEAGNATVVGSYSGGGGVVPPGVTFAANPGAYFEVVAATGLWGCASTKPGGGDPYEVGADGGVCWDGYTNVSSANNIAGLVAPPEMFLAGVFLGPSAPTTLATRLDYTTTPTTAPSYSPGIGQTFFIGDGMGTGTLTQTFYIPTGATRLFLGAVDSYAFVGSPATYGDNFGSLDVTLEFTGATTDVVPEPASLLLLATGLIGLGGVAVRQRRFSGRGDEV